MCKNELFQSSKMKNELHAKFRDENNSLTYYIYAIRRIKNSMGIIISNPMVVPSVGYG